MVFACRAGCQQRSPLQNSPSGGKGATAKYTWRSTYIAIRQAKQKLDLIAVDLALLNFRGNPSLGGIGLPRPRPYVVHLRHDCGVARSLLPSGDPCGGSQLQAAAADRGQLGWCG